MEKKGNRNLPVVRGAVSDSKKDGVSTRLWPRGCRRREPVGNSLSSKNDVSRKPQPQRIKAFDKRPKPRSSYPMVDRNETTRVDEQFELELGSVFMPGSKKQSLNHLLNFSYSPRENSYNIGKEKNLKERLIKTKKHKYNKEHFVQANCQFIVNDCGNYKQYLTDPDALVDWELIELVNVQVAEFPTCPICLYPPIAAKMTRCGHIYCWSCVLHYLAVSDKPSHTKCPICYETVQKQDLKSVVAVTHPTFNINEAITFKLMKRLRGSLIAYPIEAELKECCESISEEPHYEIYSKLILAKLNDILSIIQREHMELSNYLDTNLDDLERGFVEEALSLLKDRELKVREKNSVENKNNSISCTNNSMVELEDTMSKLTINHEGNLPMSNENVESGSSSLPKFHYFYQASDGQHIYLHAINARMLEHTYGSLQYGPKIVSGKILEKEGGSMTEDIRKRLRYLQHLPLTCQFEVAEIYLKPPIISKETLDYFYDQIESRKKVRQRRAKEERRRERRIEAEENRKMHIDPNLHLDSSVQFPDFGTEPTLRSEYEYNDPSEVSSSLDKGSPLSSSVDSAPSFSGPSFAKMLSMEKKQPVIPTVATPPLKLINAAGSKMKVTEKKRTFVEFEEDIEGYQPVPSFSKTFSDAIAQALEQAEKTEEKTDIAPSGKKKKSKKKVLFTTTMAYSG